MKKNEIKRTVEELVRVEYIAEDGRVFRNEEECKKYEESALFAVSSTLERLSTDKTEVGELIQYGWDERLDIFNIKNEKDLENLRKYLYLKLSNCGYSESYWKCCFTAESEYQKQYVFDNVTPGHEVIIFWNYEEDGFTVYGDGSLDGYLNWVKNNYSKIINPKEN